MAKVIFRAVFPGIKIRMVEKKSNPCKNLALQRHYHSGFKLVIIETSHVHKRYFWAKLVRVRSSWNEAIKNASKNGSNDCFITTELDEVVLGAHHSVGQSCGTAGDLITIMFKSTVDGFLRTHSILIPFKDQMKTALPF